MRNILGKIIINESDIKEFKHSNNSVDKTIFEYLLAEKKKAFLIGIRQLLSRKSRLSHEQIVEVLSSQKLLRNYKLFLNINNKNKQDLRIKYGLNSYIDMRNHILNEDPSGKNRGCGCMLCAVRNREYREKLWVDSFIREQKKLRHIDAVTRTISNNLTEQYGTDFDIENYKEDIYPFDIDFFNRFGSVYRRNKKLLYSNIENRDSDHYRISNLEKMGQKEPIIFYAVSSPSIILTRTDNARNYIKNKMVEHEQKLLKIRNFRKKLYKGLF